MCGSSAPKSYGSFGSSCAMNPPREAAGASPAWGRAKVARNRRAPRCRAPESSNRTRSLLDRQHAIERHSSPVLLVVGDDDLVVHAPIDELLEHPQQVIR